MRAVLFKPGGKAAATASIHCLTEVTTHPLESLLDSEIKQ